MAETETHGEVVRSSSSSRAAAAAQADVAIDFHDADAPPPAATPRVKSTSSSSSPAAAAAQASVLIWPPPAAPRRSLESSRGSEEEDYDPTFYRRRRRHKPQPCSGPIPYPRSAPVVRSSNTSNGAAAAIQRVAAAAIQRVPGHLIRASPRRLLLEINAPVAVAIGPYYHYHGLFGFGVDEMEAAKKVARDDFCRAAGQPPEAILAKVASLAADARRCYADADFCRVSTDDDEDDVGEFAKIMFVDGCFLLQFMACMCPGDRDDAPAASDGLWAKVHARVDAVARDVMLLENQLPWLVLQALMGCTPGVSWPVLEFLDLMASAFDVGNDRHAAAATALQQEQAAEDIIDLPPPPHLLGLFHRRQVGAARTQDLRVPSLSSLSCTAVELAEMGVKLTATDGRAFGDMVMSKRRRRLGVFGELALAPVVLNDVTACWLFNMVAHEACLGASCADNFAVSSYVSVVAMLANRREDVQELRGKGVVVSALSDDGTLEFLKSLAPHVRVGHRYYDVFERLHEYRKERRVWIAVHGFLYRNLRAIVALLSVAGVLAGLFKTILSLKQPQRG